MSQRQMRVEDKVMGDSGVMERLAADTKIGYSLDRRFYCDDAVFAADMQRVVGRKWIVAGHIDRVRHKGDYFLFRIGDESIIIVRSDESTVNAFYNVCRHRGSLICTKPQGRVARLTCGYHAWSYGLDGALLAARLMPDDFEKKDNGLQRCHVRVFHGFIFINLADEAPVDFDATFGDLAPYLDFHGFANAKIAHSQSYPTSANWKLIVENFVECYHCVSAHPEFCSMHPAEALVAFGAGPSSGPAEAVEKYLPTVRAWEARAAGLGRPIGTVDDPPDSTHLRLLLQRTIREGYETETQDGRPASSLMGKRAGWDQGRMYLSFSPFTQLVATNDFAVLFLFTPRSTMHTDVDLYWLVDGKASEVDVKRMIWGWDQTTKQDKEITENNQAGILSKHYRPGRYSEHERRVVSFQQWYLAQFGHALA
ncbi:MAG TPA: aromatic ring-hydroxylating dioxygenase subunit alpha [Steroidobacteraceae bacterium]|nr:aromatic ring-hydroxylating dioxygenase subunit alpha [Steroidobacteraceae bacterium]